MGWGMVAKILVIFGVICSIFYAGMRWSDSVWTPKYAKLEAAYIKYREEVKLTSAVSKGETDVGAVELNAITVYSEAVHDGLQKEVDRRVEAYLTKLSLSGLQFNDPSNRVPSPSGSTSIMPLTTIIPSNPDSSPRLFGSLDKFERAAIHRLISTRDNAITRNIECKSYLDELEKEMIPLRAKYQTSLETIAASRAD